MQTNPKQEAQLLIRRMRCLSILTGQDHGQVVESHQRAIEIVLAADNEKCQIFIDRNVETFETAKRLYGFNGTNADLDAIMREIESASAGRPPCVPLYELRRLFSHYERVLPDVDKHPMHERVFLGETVTDPVTGGPLVQLFRLDAATFENMAALYNCYAVRQKGQGSLNKSDIKTLRALAQSTIVMAMNVIEAYLNGIAYDHLARYHGKLSETVIASLSEWDDTVQKKRPKTTREKILQYPKIIAGLQHPPVQESNSASMKYLLEIAKSVRDSVVHPSAVASLVRNDFAHEEAYFGYGNNEVQKVVDSVVDLVLQVNASLGVMGRTVSWLTNRGSDGLFPQSTFE